MKEEQKNQQRYRYTTFVPLKTRRLEGSTHGHDAQKLDSSADARATRPRGTWCLSEWLGSKAVQQSLQALELSLADGWKLRMIAGVART